MRSKVTERVTERVWQRVSDSIVDQSTLLPVLSHSVNIPPYLKGSVPFVEQAEKNYSF